MTAWLLIVHAGGGHDRRSISPLGHLLRDGTLALPAVAVVVALAFRLADRLCADRCAARDRLAATVGLLAILTAAAFGVGSLLHGALFADEHEATGWMSHITTDAFWALLAAVPLAAMLAPSGLRDRTPAIGPVPAPRPPQFALGDALEGAGAPAALVLAAGTTRRRFVQYGAAGAAWIASVSGVRAYAASGNDNELSDRIDACFAGSPRGAPFTRDLVIPPVLAPVARTADADLYEIDEVASAQEIIAGIRTPIWSYGGITPGPTIMARKGRAVHVTFTNRLPADGDPGGLIVKNAVDPVESPFIEPGTVVHLHGINADPVSDGYATDVRLPGESLTHRYPNNEDQRPATLWYHDHQVHITGHHLFRGMAALYLLTDAVEDALPLPKGYGRHDIPLVLDDVMIDPASGVLLYDNCSHTGAFGDVMVVNGRQQPRLQVANRRYRFRVLNASDARQYVLALDDGGTFHTIGSDHGLLDAPVLTDNQHLVVAERVELVIDFARYPVGSRVVLVNRLVERDDPVHQIMAFDVVRAEVDDSRLPATLRPTGDPAPPSARRRFELERRGGRWALNGLTWDPGRVDAFPQLDTTEEWEFVTNSGGWGHPMHIHLGRFKIVSIEGRARRPDETGWKDTVWVGPNQTIRVVHEFKNFTGRFMFHCHNASHEDHTMMSQFEVIPGPPRDGPAKPTTPEPDGAPQQVPPPEPSNTAPPPSEFPQLARRASRRRPSLRRSRSRSRSRMSTKWRPRRRRVRRRR